ncbi:MAG: hypothetical protein Q4C79_01685 [Neisseria sp.]|uniref:hypothetical protein n=1 Tax=Neisseria sp. TaxID=192066 RepID=UPI0026DC4F18|nr:hypothetical protein [Neisseria sp.]MDO4247673.1 hypothetical protein [Neisseria sp.]
MHSRFYKLVAPVLYIAIFFIGYFLASAYAPANYSVLHDNISVLAALAAVPVMALFAWLALKQRAQDFDRRAAMRPFLHVEVISDLGNSLLLVLSNVGQDGAKYIRLSDMGSSPIPFLPDMIQQLPVNDQYFALIENRPERSQSFLLMAEYQDSSGNACSNILNIELPALSEQGQTAAAVPA